MKYILAIILTLALLSVYGCANTPIAQTSPAQATANIQTQQYQACLVYNASAGVINQKLGTLPLAQANTLYAATKQATALCTTVFTNSAQAQAQLTQSLATIATLAAINNLK